MTDETTLVIFGASGDLTSRLLLPALGQLLTLEPNRAVRLVGAGMDDWSDDKWRKVVRASFAEGGAEAEVAARVHAEYLQADITAARGPRADPEGSHRPTRAVLRRPARRRRRLVRGAREDRRAGGDGARAREAVRVG